MTSLALEVRVTLEQIAERANREHALVEAHLSDAVLHAFAAGSALNEAFARVPEGEWSPWLAENFLGSETMARLYRRMHTYRDTLRAHGIATVNAAQRFLAEAQLQLEGATIGRRNLQPPLSQGQVQEIRKLRKAGLSQREIARVCGISRNSVQRYLDPASKTKRRQEESRRRRRQASQALQKAETAKVAKHVGGELGKAYSSVRSVAALLDASLATSTGDRKKAVSEALAAIYRAEDAIGRAVRL